MKPRLKPHLLIAEIVRRQLNNVESPLDAELHRQINHIEDRLELLMEHRRRRHWCWERRLEVASAQVRRQALDTLKDLYHELQSAFTVKEIPQRIIPTVGDIVRELQQIEDEFGDWTYKADRQTLSVNTEAIELEDVNLGRFSIELQLLKLQPPRDAFRVIALNPNPPVGNDTVTHPHVQNNKLCVGDGGAAIFQSLTNGRLCDFFQIVRGILNTYNPDSPYVRLEVWAGGCSCYDCGDHASADDAYFCDGCDHDFCEYCISSCAACGSSQCSECLDSCEVCKERFCPGCLEQCKTCDRHICSSCMSVGQECKDCAPATGETLEATSEASESAENQTAEPAEEPQPITATQENHHATAHEPVNTDTQPGVSAGSHETDQAA